ncbi:MAG TPA: PatB family C-S lyase [Tepidisphaeraceae bacterium]|jgi:cystathionine beta-lyase
MPPKIELDITALRHPDSFKWTRYPADVLPLWVADMDFAIAPSIKQALVDRLNSPIGYHASPDALSELLHQKLQKMGISGIPTAGISFINGVVQGLYAAVAGITSPGDSVLTMTPIYPPFLSAITDQGREAHLVPLKQSENSWLIDWSAMEAAVTPTTRLLMLCHPHNPTGRAWARAELEQIANFARKHNLVILSDELHADLTLDGPFVPFAAAADREMQMRTVTLTGPCKTYNTAGLSIGAMFSHNLDLLSKMKRAIYGIGSHPATLSFTMWHAALRDDGQWLAQVLNQLRDNRETLRKFISERLPIVRFSPPQATYLAWLDCRNSAQAGDIQKYLLENAKVALNPGTDFGPGNEGFARLNFATSPVILNEALESIATALE